MVLQKKVRKRPFTKTKRARSLPWADRISYALLGVFMKSFWQHTNGKVYAIRSNSFGNITGAAGPFDPDDLKGLDDYQYGQGIIDWVKRAIAERKLCRINATLVN